MAQFTNTFTGKDTAVRLPSGEGVLRSQENMNNLFLKAEQLKYETFKKNEDDFLKASAIDPVSSISNAATEYQSKLIDTFNQKWASEMQKNGGNMSTEQKIEMMKDRRFIEAEGDKVQTMQKAWEMEDALVKKDPLTYDDAEHAQKTRDFMTTGQFDYNDVPWRARSVAEDLIKLRGRIGQEHKESFVKDPNFPYLVTDADVTGTREEIAPIIKERVLSDPRVKKHMLQEWSKIDEATKSKYLDVNKDGIVSEDERRASNPILEWYTDENYSHAIERKTGTTRDTRRGQGSGGGSQWSKVEPASAMNSPFPGLPSDEYHPFKNVTRPVVIPVASMELLEPDKAITSTEEPQQAIKGYVTGYDRKSDKITLLVSQDYKDIDYPSLASGRGMQVAVKRSDLSKEVFDDLPIIVNGKMTRLRDVVPAPNKDSYKPNVPLQTTSGVKWK